MTTINQLPLLTTLAGGDNLVVWSPNNGDSRRVPYSVIKADTRAGLMTLTEPGTFANKTFNLNNNTLIGTLSQFNAACTDADFVSVAALAASTGASTVGFLQSGTSAVLRTAQDKMREWVNVDDFGAVGDGTTDDSAAFTAALAASTYVIATAGKIYVIKDIVVNGRTFDGRGCVLRDAPGAQWGIKINGYGAALKNFSFQDQGNYVSTTTLSAGMAPSANVAVVTSATGINIGDVFFVNLDANELRHQTFVTGVAGNSITIRDAIPTAAAAGKEVNVMLAAVMVGAADHWVVENILVINARGGLLTKPETDLVLSNRGSVQNFQTDGCRYFGWIKAGNAAGIKAYDIKLWCGYVETFNYTGSGIAGPYSFSNPVFLLRDVTVTVNGVPQVYLTDWNYASQTSIQFLAGRFPAAGAAIVISNFRDGYRGFVDDQRSTAIISGGNLFDSVEALDAFIGASFFESELTEVRSLISDTCQYVGVQLNSCPNTLVFSSECFLGFSGSSLKLFNSNPKAFVSLYTQRVPLGEQWLAALDDNIYIDSTSDLTISAVGWSGEFQTAAATGGTYNFEGGEIFRGRNVANVAAASTVYIAEAGAVAVMGDALWRAPRPMTAKKLRVDVNIAPGAGQSYTYDVLVAGVSIGQAVISGAGVFSATTLLNTFVPTGAQINLQLITSAGAATNTRHFAQMIAS